MAAKKKRKSAARKSTKKTARPARRAGKRAQLDPGRSAAPPRDLKALDAGWRRFIDKSVPDEPLTQVWEAPQGAPSLKSTIAAAAKSLRKTAAKAAAKSPKKKAVRAKAGTKTPARKSPARKRAAKKK